MAETRSGFKPDLAALIEPLARHFWGEPNPHHSNPKKGELRWGTNGARSISIKKGTWFDHETNTGGGVLDLIERETGRTGADRFAWLSEHGFEIGDQPKRAGGKDHGAVVASKQRPKIVNTYDYTDEAGNLLRQVVRFEPKAFRQRRPDGNGGWTWSVKDVRQVPYRLPGLREAVSAGKAIFIVEGEKDVDRLRAEGFVATCNAGGAGRWQPELSEHFTGADVVLIPDNDDIGFQHVQEVGAALSGVANRIRVVVLPGLPPKGDVSNWIDAGGSREALEQLVAQAADWRPMAPAGDDPEKAKANAQEDKLIAELARMRPGIEFARQRARLAKDLGVTRGAIDAELEARRTNNEIAAAPLHGHWIVEPWPEPVEGNSLLRDIILRIRRHVVCAHDDALAVALWIMLSWVHNEVATHSPILNINSAEPESGKSTTLGLVSFLAPRCVASVEISEAALYRAIKLWQPSFAIDEFDSVLANEDKVALRSVMKSGHTRGSGVVRCVGDDKTPERFPTFCPKAIGMCGRKLPAATLSRCIFVELRRKRSGEKIERFEHKDDAGLAELRQRLARWAIDNEGVLLDAKPSMPAELENRRADNWRLQLAIADLAGEDWGEQARAVALKIEGKTDTRTAGVRLLADIKALFDADLSAHCMHSARMVDELLKDQDKPWVEFTRGKPLTQNRLARLLGAYGVTSQTVTPPGLKDGKGYYRSQFEDAWARYLPSPIGPDTS